MTQSISDIFPLLIPQNADLTDYAGFLTIQNQNFKFRITLPEDGVVQNSLILCDEQLHDVLYGHEDVVSKRLEQSKSIASFLFELKALLERLVRSRKPQQAPPAAFYTRIMTELPQIGWENIVSMSSDLRTITIQATDSAGRQHRADLLLTADYPASPPKCRAALPQVLEPVWNQNASRLRDIVAQFNQALRRHQRIWNLLDDIDANCCVIEPEHPTRADVARRIIVAKFVSLQIDINPSSPQGLPECKFFGADTMIAPLRQLLNNNLNRWNETKTICQNLEHILQIQFPSPASREAQGEELRVQCQICYAYRHPEIGDTPDRVCDNPRCGNSFHSHPCLLEWLQSSSTKRVSFDSVSGECPYCMFPITVKLMRRSK